MPRHNGSCREPLPKGVYVLLFQGSECRLSIGALGERIFSSGWYAYIGSAQGTGGFARVHRHHALYLQKDRLPRWHIDYLLLDSHFYLRYVVCGPTAEDHECRLAHFLGPPSVPGFGCSDCRCPSHLLYRHSDPREEIVRALGRLGISPIIKTIKSPG